MDNPPTQIPPRHVGGWLYKTATLADDEQVILQDRCHHKLKFWSWRLGKCFVTSQRIIWAPTLEPPEVFAGVVSIPLAEITEIRLQENRRFIGMPRQWRVRANSRDYFFSSGWSIFRPKTQPEEWVGAVKDLLKAAPS